MHLNYLRPVNIQSKGMFSVFLHLNSPQGAPSQEAWGVGWGGCRAWWQQHFMFTGMAGQHSLSIPLWFWKHTSLVQHSGWIISRHFVQYVLGTFGGRYFAWHWGCRGQSVVEYVTDSWETHKRHTKYNYKGHHSSTCLLSTKHCAEDTAMKKTHKNLCLQEVYVDVMGDQQLFP